MSGPVLHATTSLVCITSLLPLYRWEWLNHLPQATQLESCWSGFKPQSIWLQSLNTLGRSAINWTFSLGKKKIKCDHVYPALSMGLAGTSAWCMLGTRVTATTISLWRSGMTSTAKECGSQNLQIVFCSLSWLSPLTDRDVEPFILFSPSVVL